MVELINATSHCSISLNLVDSELIIDAELCKLVNNIFRDVSDDEYKIKYISISYLVSLIIDAFNCGHGNLIAVTDNTELLQSEVNSDRF